MENKIIKWLPAGLGSFLLIPILCILLILFSATADISDDNTENNENLENVSITLSQYNFIMQIVDYSYQSRKENNFLTSVTVAQAIVESSWGTSNVAVQSNNLFGIKKGSWKGKTYKGYRKYTTLLESVKDHDKILCGKSYNLKNEKDLEKITTKLQEIYAPESDGNVGYKNNILSIISKYDLTQFDDLNTDQLQMVRSKSYVMNSFGSPNSVNEGDSKIGNEIAKKALTRIGLVYVWGGCHSMNEVSNPNWKKFDCSGLVSWAYYQAGVNIGIQTTKTLATYDKGKDIEFDELQPGDILLYSSNGKLSGVHHVTIYIGNNMVVHAPSSGKKITTKPAANDKKHLYKCRRLY